MGPDLGALALETTEPPSNNTGPLIGIAAAVAMGVARLAGGHGFLPRRGGKPPRFRRPACRVQFHKARYQVEAHRCPLCGKGHEL